MSNAEAHSIRVVSRSQTESNAVAMKGSHRITATKFNMRIEPTRERLCFVPNHCARVQASLDAVTKAKNSGAAVSCDLNYRKKLWSREKAGRVMEEIVTHTDLFIANEEDAESVFGIRAANTNVHTGVIDVEKYQSVAEQLMKRFPQLIYVAITLRESISTSLNNWSAVLWNGRNLYQSKKYNIHVVDRIGSGDVFCAGLIYNFLHQKEEQDALEFAVAASCLKHSIQGDFNLVNVEEVEALMKGDATGRVKR